MRYPVRGFVLGVVAMTGACVVVPDFSDEPPEEDGDELFGPGGEGAGSPPPEGFVGIEGLGDCAAIAAETASEHYQPLTLMPCVDGTPRCEEVVWDGVVDWDPTGGGSLLEWEPQLGLDAAGRASHLLLAHRYPRDTTGNSYHGLPFEAVVYALDAGTPTAAWRNQGWIGPSPWCEIVPVLGQDRLWLLGFTGGTHAVSVASAPLAGDVPHTLTATAIDPSVLVGHKAASSQLLALESSDGRLYRVDATGEVEESFGPGMRVWLHSVVGDQVIVETDQVHPPAFTYFRFGADGFHELLPSAGPLATDGTRLAWIEPGSARRGRPRGPRVVWNG